MNCVDWLDVVGSHGQMCHPVGLYPSAVLCLRMASIRKVRVGAPGTYLRRLQVSLNKHGLLDWGAGGWTWTTEKGSVAIGGQLCRNLKGTNADLSHAVRGECWIHSGNGYILGMCDSRPKCWSSVSGAVVDGRFSQLCA